MIRQLMTRLWNDESGSIIATEYLMLGTVVALGSATGMVTVRDSINEEYQEYGNTVREVRQAHTKGLPKGKTPPASATSLTDMSAPTGQPLNVTFACP